MLIDDLEQHFEGCALNAQNAQKSDGNQINNLNTSKNEIIKIFRGFLVFEYALQENTKTRKRRKSLKSPLNQKKNLTVTIS